MPKFHILRRTKVVGIEYHSSVARHALQEAIDIGDPMVGELRAEDDNSHDRYAVAVWLYSKAKKVKWHHVGYVPAHCAGAVRLVMHAAGVTKLPAAIEGEGEDGIWSVYVSADVKVT
mgnify:CR=1 FL=1